MKIAIATMAVEDLTKSFHYTICAQLFLNKWNKQYPTYVWTNNISLFPKESTLLTNKQVNMYDRFRIIDILFKKGYELVIYIDPDRFPCKDTTIEYDKLKSVSAARSWSNDEKHKWGSMKSIEYFKDWIPFVRLPDDTKFYVEDMIAVKKEKWWNSAYQLLKEYENLDRNNHIKMNGDIDSVGNQRLDAISFTAICNILNVEMDIENHEIKKIYKNSFHIEKDSFKNGYRFPFLIRKDLNF